MVTSLEFEIGTESFSASGKELIHPGFTKTMHWQALPPEERMPELKPNQTVPISEVNERLLLSNCVFNLFVNSFSVTFSEQMKLLERLTSPPDYLTESELITLMEKHGIGTVRIVHFSLELVFDLD